jgi:hypothetical protein
MSQLFLGYNAVFIKKGRIFQKESNLYGNSYYEREEGSPYKKNRESQFHFVTAARVKYIYDYKELAPTVCAVCTDWDRGFYPPEPVFKIIK